MSTNLQAEVLPVHDQDAADLVLQSPTDEWDARERRRPGRAEAVPPTLIKLLREPAGLLEAELPDIGSVPLAAGTVADISQDDALDIELAVGVARPLDQDPEFENLAAAIGIMNAVLLAAVLWLIIGVATKFLFF